MLDLSKLEKAMLFFLKIRKRHISQLQISRKNSNYVLFPKNLDIEMH